MFEVKSKIRIKIICFMIPLEKCGASNDQIHRARDALGQPQTTSMRPDATIARPPVLIEIRCLWFPRTSHSSKLFATLLRAIITTRLRRMRPNLHICRSHPNRLELFLGNLKGQDLKDKLMIDSILEGLVRMIGRFGRRARILLYQFLQMFNSCFQLRVMSVEGRIRRIVHDDIRIDTVPLDEPLPLW